MHQPIKPLSRKTAYMEGAEFKERQKSFSFYCAKSYDFIKTFIKECRAGWWEVFHLKREEKKPEQLSLNLNAWIFAPKLKTA